MERDVQIVAIAGSNREGSLNRRLLQRAIEALDQQDRVPVSVDVVDLRAHPLPLYDADLHQRDGIPEAAAQIHDRIAAADAVLFANPEYNGGYPALWKNVVDWVSRVDMLVLHPRYVGLLSASPGKGGGRRGIEHTRGLLANMFVTTHPEGFALPHANDALGDDGWADADEAARMARWAEGFAQGALAHVEERASQAA